MLVRIFQCPHVPNRWIVTHLSASLAHRARTKTIAEPKTNPSCVHYSIRGDLFQIWDRVGSDVRLDYIFTSERSERVTITISKQYIYIILPSVYFVLLPNFVSHIGHHIAHYYVEIVLFM